MSSTNLSGFTASQLEEMAADDHEDARNASRQGNTEQRRELDASAAELNAKAGW